jgi:hypothetical protein
LRPPQNHLLGQDSWTVLVANAATSLKQFREGGWGYLAQSPQAEAKCIVDPTPGFFQFAVNEAVVHARPSPGSLMVHVGPRENLSDGKEGPASARSTALPH